MNTINPQRSTSASIQGGKDKPSSIKELATNELASKLEIDPGKVQITGARRTVINMSTLGFPVKGQLQMSGAGEVQEYNLQAGDDSYLYRGTGSFSRIGLDIEHDGGWMKDARGIYVPAQQTDDRAEIGKADPYADFDVEGLARRLKTKQPVAQPAPPSTEVRGTPSLPKADINGEELTPQQLTKADLAARDLAGKLEVSADDVNVKSFKETMVTTSYGYGVQGELMMSGMFEGIELQMSVGEETFRYRGDGERGRVGVESDHDGWWVKDHRGVYLPGAKIEEQGGWW